MIPRTMTLVQGTQSILSCSFQFKNQRDLFQLLPIILHYFSELLSYAQDCSAWKLFVFIKHNFHLVSEQKTLGNYGYDEKVQKDPQGALLIRNPSKLYDMKKRYQFLGHHLTIVSCGKSFFLL